jgi:vitamin B12 transporter
MTFSTSCRRFGKATRSGIFVPACESGDRPVAEQPARKIPCRADHCNRPSAGKRAPAIVIAAFFCDPWLVVRVWAVSIGAHAMQHDYSQFQKQMKKRLLPLAIAMIGGGISPLWAQTVESLDTVVVTASRVLEAKREISSNVTIISEEDIKASTATSLADLMVQQGFNVATTGDTSAVQIRGMGSLSMPNELENSVLILLNGRRIGNTNLALAGLANVKRVEIIRGPAAVQYGSSALGGVINVITKQGKDAKPFAALEVGIGSDSLKREKLAFGASANGFDFAFGGTNFSRDDVTVSNDRRWYHTAIDKDQVYNLDLGYTFNKNHRVGINYNYSNIKSELSDAMAGGIRPFSGNIPNAPYDDYKKINKNTAISYIGSMDDKNLDWLINYSFGNNMQKVNDPLSGARESKDKIDNEIFNAQLNYHAQLFSLSGGVDQIKYDTSTWSFYKPNLTAKGKMKDTGVYVTGKLRFLDENLIFSLGLRRDKYDNTSNTARSKSDSHTGGSVGVSYLLTNWLKLRANYAEGFKMPSPNQISGGLWNFANPSLAPEKSKTYEFGADISWNHLNGSLTWFRSDWKDKILAKSIGNYTYQYVNLKDVRLAGLEGSLSYDLGKAFKQNYSLSPYVNFTYLGTRKNKDPREYIPYNGLSSTMPNTPKWMAAYGIDYAHPGLKLRTRLNANYYGKLITQDWSKTGAPYFARPSGTVVNWSLEKELTEFSGQYGRLTLRTEVNNLFDKDNEMWWSYPGPGRSFYVGLRYDY